MDYDSWFIGVVIFSIADVGVWVLFIFYGGSYTVDIFIYYTFVIGFYYNIFRYEIS